MILDILKWYLVLLWIGAIGFAFVFPWLKQLPGRGSAFSRAVGLILVSFIFWLGGMLSLLRNDLGSLLAVILGLTAAAVWLYVKNWDELREWTRANRGYLIGTEIVFAAAFALMVVMRLGGPDISGTEKPMEIMFINSILKSDTFPPRDSWLSGYSISYYYFGYIMSAVLIRLSGVLSSVGFNLMLCTVFAMAAVSAYALVNDLLHLRASESGKTFRFKLRALIAPVFVLIAGNLEGLFELLHSLGLFWNEDGTSSFWSWVGLKELVEAPTRAAAWDITGRSGIWWWRASRVLGDYGMNGNAIEVIDEFPMFSFELGDLHPHVIAIPFVMLCIAIALNAFLKALRGSNPRLFFAEGLLGENHTLAETDLVRWMCSADFWLTAVCVGALLFLNTWDFPFYYGLYCLGVTAAYIHRNGWRKEAFTLFFETALPLAAGCILLYALFFMGFASQAGGIVPSGIFVTRTVLFLIMFGMFIFPVLVWQIWKLRGCGKTARSFGFWMVFWLFVGLMIIETILFVLLLALHGSSAGGTLKLAGDSFAGVQGINDLGTGLYGFITRRVWALPTLFILFAVAAIAFILVRQFAKADGAETETKIVEPIDVFVSLMMLIAAALVIFPEFFYLRDLFGTRMNTIFKFYYQAWILFGLSASYAVIDLLEGLKPAAKAAFAVPMTLLFACAMIYPYFCVTGKVQSASNRTIVTLDGANYLKRTRADWEALRWLEDAEPGVVLEKVGSSYGSDNLMSTFGGLQAVLGPAGHESQWRGGYNEIGSRADDVQTIYETRSWETAKELIDKYNVRYVYIGTSEKSAYNIQSQKFDRNLTLVYDSDGCQIYQVY